MLRTHMPSRLLHHLLLRPLAIRSARRSPLLLAIGLFLVLVSAAPAGAQVSLHLRSLARAGSIAAPQSQVLPARTSGVTEASADNPLDPGQIRRAYDLPSTGAKGQKIAIVTAYDDPYAQADLTAYDKQWGLRACTSAGRCLEKLNEAGKSSPLPPTDLTGGTWITESAIGTEVARGVCQSCSILLVEANSTGRADFSEAVATAARAGATVIVTTFFDIEQNTDSQYALDYLQKKAAVVSAVGDAQSQYGYTGEGDFPSTLPYVLAVGGTTLSTGSGGSYGSEQAWNGTVSGCSLYQPAPAWQAAQAAAVGCQKRRAVADLSAMADPGAAVHITGAGTPGGPWYAATGTSLSAPILAGVIGLAGSAGSREPAMLYAHAHSDPGALHDVRTGVNAPNCTTVICQARRGFDGPTGLGTPFGLAAFLSSGGALNRAHPDVSLSVPRSGVRASGGWKVTLAVRNQNPFAVTGSLGLRRTLSVAGRRRTIVFATKSFKLAPLAGQKLTLTIAAGDRALLRQLGRLVVNGQLSVRGPVKPTVRKSSSLTLSAP
jgi:hypothetical protein